MLSTITSILDRAGIAWAIIGASALAAHGVSRSTLDSDLLVVDPRVLAATSWEGLPREITVEIRRGDAQDPLGGVVRFSAAGERPVDLVVGRASWQAAVLARAASVEINGTPLRIAQPADLILLKLYAGGLQDRWDIEQLLAVRDRRPLMDDVDARITELPASAREIWKSFVR